MSKGRDVVGERLFPGALLTAVLVLSVPVVADVDPNDSQEFPTDGYGIVICGNSHVEYGLVDDTIKNMLRYCYTTLTDIYAFSPNNVWVHVDDGNNDANWTQGLFDDLPATEGEIAATFQTIGQRMWTDANTPRNLMIIIGGHGGSGYWYDPDSMEVQLADGMIWDYEFVSDVVNQINNNGQNGSPVERLDVIMTMCYSGGLIGDFRTNFHNLRGSTWPNAQHLSLITAGDGYDITTGFLGLQLLNAIGGGLTPVDLNGDGVISIWENFHAAAQADVTNPVLESPPYVPYISDTIYVPSLFYLDLGYAEHPLYYEWNAPLAVKSLALHYVNEPFGVVELDPEPADANNPVYAEGTEVTLTAIPDPNRVFTHWEVYDPNFPGDANHCVIDSNATLVLVMDTDHEVTAVFRCGSGVRPVLPLVAIGIGVFGLTVVRARRRR